MKRLIFIVSIIGIWTSCTSTDEKGFSETPTGLKYQIYSIGDVNHELHDSDICTLDIKIYTVADSLIYTSETPVELLFRSKKDTGLMEWMGLLAVNDSSTSIISNQNIRKYFQQIDESYGSMKVTLVIKNAEPYAQWAFYKKYPELRAKDLELEEQKQLQRLLGSYTSDSVEYIGGIFKIVQVTGSGVYPELNHEVVLHSTGKTISGKLVESTAHRNEAFSYIIGQKDQVIEGFDLAVRHMRKGERSKVIVPSHLAYGSKGSTTGIVKPFETLIFEIEILDILESSKD